MKRVGMIWLGIILCAFFAFHSEAQEKKAWPLKGVTIGAAPVGGVYYVWAGGPAKILVEKLGLPASVESTGGPVHNTQLVNAKELHFGMVTAAPVYEGWHGLGWAKGRKHQNVRVVFPMYTTYFHMYALKKTGIKSIKDLNGKSVGTGPVGGTPATYWPLILEAGGIKPKRIVNASSSDLDNQLKDGLLDANGQSGFFAPSFISLSFSSGPSIPGISARPTSFSWESSVFSLCQGGKALPETGSILLTASFSCC